MTSNLPNWPGADTVYARLQRINTALCKRAYEAAASARPRGRKRVDYAIPEEVRENIQWMNSGDEEACKAAVARHLSLALT